METLLHAGLSNAVTATFLALLVACLGRVLVRRPAVLHCLWLVVLLKLVTPPLYEVSIPWPRAFTEVLEPAPTPDPALFERAVGIGQYALPVPGAIDAAELSGREIILELAPGSDLTAVRTRSGTAADSLAEWLPSDWMRLVAMVWLAGTVAVLVLSARRVWKFQRLLREAQPAGEDTQDRVDELANSLGLVRPPSAWWIGGNLSPLVWALGLRPRLIIPTALWKSLDDRQRSTLIVHELAHLRRGDHRVRIFELIVTALFWWHPVLWWARRALHDVEEQCCDAWVVWAFPESAKSYAETLLETLDFLNQSDRSVPLLASGFGKVRHLRKRLTMIMSGTTPRLLGLRGALASLGMAALLLPVNPTWAQKPDQKQDIRIIVKLDDDSSKPTDVVGLIQDVKPEIIGAGTVTLGDLVLNVDGQTITTQDSKQPNVVHLEVKTDDSSISVTADSMKAAIDKLKDQIKVLAAKSSPSEREKAKKALDRVVKELESQINKRPKSGEHRVLNIEKGEPEIQLRLEVRGEKDAKTVVGRMEPFDVIEMQDDRNRDTKVNPETKAQIEKARARVKELARSLEENHRKLMEAQRKLSQLEGGHHPSTVEVHALPKVVARVARLPEVVHGEDVVVYRDSLKLQSNSDKKPAEPKRFVITERVVNKQAGEPNQGRLEELEKKLQQLLEEVANLKKERGR